MGAATVLIPFREGGNEEWLRQAVNSFPNGTRPLVLRNDGELAEALNVGLREADTEYVLVFGADDAALPGFMEELVRLSHGVDVVYPSQVYAGPDLRPLAEFPAEPFCGNRLLQMNFVSGAALIRREKALEVGGYRVLPGMSDWDLWVRMHKAGARFKPAQNARFLYRQHDHPGRVSAGYRGDAGKVDEIRRLIVGDNPTRHVRATFYAGATPATTYLRAQLPARYLPGVVRREYVAHVKEDDFEFPEHLGGAAVFLYPGDKTSALLSQGLRVKGVRVLVEVDDNYLINPGREILDASGWSLKTGERPYSRQGHRWIAANADGVIVTNPLLAEAYRKVNPNVYVCPNSVDPGDWPEPVKPDDGVFRIAWVASKSHRDDHPLVKRAFEWAARQKGVEVYMAGLEGFRFARQIPWQDDLDAYRGLFRNFDVSVAPIRRHNFALYRSDVKALESAMGLACPVLSDVPPYDGWRDGENCLKARDGKGFYHAIKHLVANRDEARRLAGNARAYTLKERTTQAQIGLWREAVDG